MNMNESEASMATVIPIPEANEQPAYWSGVFAMTLCVFALIASEFMLVSLLTPMADDLHVTEGLAGQGITISGAFAVLTSLSIPWLAGAVNRKTLLLALTGMMAVSGVVVAMAPDYQTYMVGRAHRCGHRWFLVPVRCNGHAPGACQPGAQGLAIFNGGNALATVIAAPLGSYLGAVIGWRGAFFLWYL
jgi:predicted MFS family arabinose efflux permease